ELKAGISTLGYGGDHAEDVLLELAEAGRGRYAFVPAPELCRVELARAVGAHAEAVARGVALRLEPRRGVRVQRGLDISIAQLLGKVELAPVEVPLADFLPAERRTLAFALEVPAYEELGTAAIAKLTLREEGAAPVELEV